MRQHALTSLKTLRAPDGSGSVSFDPRISSFAFAPDLTASVLASVTSSAREAQQELLQARTHAAYLLANDPDEQRFRAVLAAKAARVARLDRLPALPPADRLDLDTGELVSLLPGPVVRRPFEDEPTPADSSDESARDRRRFSYALQSQAAKLRPGERVACCHRLPQDASLVEIRRGEDGRSFLGGVQTCGSVWLCPVCAAKITEARRADLQHLSTFTRAAGGSLLMLTLTVPHQRHDALALAGFRTVNGEARPADVGMLSRLTAAWRFFVSGGSALSVILAPDDYLGFVRGLEVTHGAANGWHPHFHVLIALGAEFDPERLPALQARLYARWKLCCEREGFGTPDPVHGLHLVLASVAGLDVDPVTQYVSKWGCAEELSKLHSKIARRPGAGRSPWALLHDALNGSASSGLIWKEYASAFKGRRQLVWSRGLRVLVGLGPDELPDEQIAAAGPAVQTVVYPLSRVEWHVVRVVGSRAALLDASDSGPVSLAAYLDHLHQTYALERGPLPDRLRFGVKLE